MAPNIIQARYDDLENIATRFAQQAEANTAMLGRVQQVVSQLQNGGWEGEGATSFFNEMDNEVVPAVNRLNTALEQASSVTLKIKDTFQTAEEEAAAPFREDGKEIASPKNLGIPTIFGEKVDEDGGAPSIMPYGPGSTPSSRKRMSYTTEDGWTDTTDKKKTTSEKIDDYVDGFVKFGEKKWGGDEKFLGEGEPLDNLQIGIAGYEAGGSAKWGISEHGLEGSVEGGAAVYAIKAEYTTELAGADIAIEAQVGASIKGDAKITFNPLEGDLKGEIGGEAFVGASASGSITKEMGGVEAKLQGEVGYGIGGRFKAEAGFEDGKFKADFDVAGYIGVGTGAKFTVEVDVKEVAENIVNVGKKGVEIAGAIGDLFGW